MNIPLPQGLITGHTAKLPGIAGDLKKHQDGPRQDSDSGLELGFWRLWCSQCPSLPRPWHDLQFAWPDRKWRFDFAWPSFMLAVEIEGSAHGGGRHQRRTGFRADTEKYNEAAKRGWRLLRFASDELKERPIQVIQDVAAVLAKLMEK